jgi:hypothetical protein
MLDRHADCNRSTVAVADEMDGVVNGEGGEEPVEVGDAVA